MKADVLLLTGATASGKTTISLQLAKKYPIEIISVDSRQVYRHLNIGTAKAEPKERETCPHHLIDIIDVDEKFSAGLFRKLCKKTIENIIARGNIPLLLGGTFFYIKALWDGLMVEPQIDIRLNLEIDSLPIEHVRKRLEKVDPISFARIKANDSYRNRRALLISESGEKPYSQYTLTDGLFNDYHFHSFWLDVDREQLYQRINDRVKVMFEKGWLEEIHNILNLGYSKASAGLNTIGYKQILASSQDIRKMSQDEIDKIGITIATATRHFAKRQLTWFRNDSRLKKVDHSQAVLQLSEKIEMMLSKGSTHH